MNNKTINKKILTIIEKKMIKKIMLVLAFTFTLLNTALADDNVQNKDNNIEDTSKYANYLSYDVKDLKCEGYDFDPSKVERINLRGQKEDGGWRSVVLNNGKRFKITNTTQYCMGKPLIGKDSYKQLPEGCRLVIGDACVSPVPDCKRMGKYSNTCLDKEVEQDYQLFQWEATNKGWERMTSYREYWEDYID